MKNNDPSIHYVQKISIEGGSTPAWYDLKHESAVIKYYNDGSITESCEYYGFRRSLPYESTDLSYGMHKDEADCVYTD